MSLDIQGEFSLDDYEACRKSARKLFRFMDLLHKVAVKYKQELLAGGCSEAAIDGIPVICGKLLEARTAQGVFIKGRPKVSEGRIILLNKLFDPLVGVNAAAQIVFLDDAAKRAQIVFNPRRRPRRLQRVHRGGARRRPPRGGPGKLPQTAS